LLKARRSSTLPSLTTPTALSCAPALRPVTGADVLGDAADNVADIDGRDG
jgi:hypothetical protein